jgi:hypothetical protein
VWSGGLNEDFWRHLFWRDMCRVPEKVNESERAGKGYYATKSYIERWPNVGDFPEQWFVWGRNNSVMFEGRDAGFVEALAVGFESALKMFCDHVVAFVPKEQGLVFVVSAIPFILMAHEKNLVEDEKMKVFIEHCEKTWSFEGTLMPHVVMRNAFEKNLLAKVIEGRVSQIKVRLAL